MPRTTKEDVARLNPINIGKRVVKQGISAAIGAAQAVGAELSRGYTTPDSGKKKKR